ncbi:MAG: glycine cleavage system protein GcvH [SAR202 cluster bacterium]|nr:glycine cleavage system protein GcvH [SAR202 cluster bacterium]
MDIPADRKYSKEHEWAKPEADGTVLVGISFFAQDQLGDVVYIDLPKPGAKLTQFSRFGEIESVKAVSELYAPVSGEVVEANEAVAQKPELVNQAPYDSWLIRVRAANQQELNNLLDAKQYAELTATGGH